MLEVVEITPLVYTAHSKLSFFCRDAICEYVLKNDSIPINPFRLFGYFLSDRVDRDIVRRANNSLLLSAQEVWVFGTEISNGVLAEIHLGQQHGKTIRYFTVAARADEIRPASERELTFEPELLDSVAGDEDSLHRVVSGERSLDSVKV